MRIAIASTGNSYESFVNKQFGHCAYFVIYDTDSKAVEFIPNPNKDLDENAGTASVQLIASKNVTKIISGEFGMKIKPLLDSLKIQMIVVKNPNLKIKDVIEMLNH
ncbi:MAG: NifB/NifX family molybdenum-iron cluster-binding protein [Desulfurella sp.]